jgi:hypothetical protein
MPVSLLVAAEHPGSEIGLQSRWRRQHRRPQAQVHWDDMNPLVDGVQTYWKSGFMSPGSSGDGPTAAINLS